jgi:hypothetical protein
LVASLIISARAGSAAASISPLLPIGETELAGILHTVAPGMAGRPHCLVRCRALAALSGSAVSRAQLPDHRPLPAVAESFLTVSFR